MVFWNDENGALLQGFSASAIWRGEAPGPAIGAFRTGRTSHGCFLKICSHAPILLLTRIAH
jgi:hypothetical protein